MSRTESPKVGHVGWLVLFFVLSITPAGAEPKKGTTISEVKDALAKTTFDEKPAPSTGYSKWIRYFPATATPTLSEKEVTVLGKLENKLPKYIVPVGDFYHIALRSDKRWWGALVDSTGLVHALTSQVMFSAAPHTKHTTLDFFSYSAARVIENGGGKAPQPPPPSCTPIWRAVYTPPVEGCMVFMFCR
jgi:hypothetical protein